MEKPIYDFQSSSNGHYYFFDSIGSTIIKKVVGFIATDQNPLAVELVFGDLTDDNQIDVLSVSDNDDFETVIGTLISILIDYLNQFPNKTVLFRGSTPSRTRLYRAIIAKKSADIEPLYKIFGILENGSVEKFDKSHSYLWYIITVKK